MFPTIYGIALGGIDSRAHKIGAAGLIMAIVGGALLTPWMAQIIGNANSIWANLTAMFDSTWDTNLKLSQVSLRASFIVPAICFAVVLAYSLIFAKKSNSVDNHNDNA
jgi:FHS family L-fucose permease-like MFS transporter